MRLFISYAHVDKHQVSELVEVLREAAYDPWFDHKLMPGQNWKAELKRAIELCEAFLYALTPESVDSEWCQWEYAEAVKIGKPIIPVLLRAKTKLPDSISTYQYADFSEGPTPRAVARLLGGLRLVAVVVPPAEAPAVPAEPSGVPAQAVESTSTSPSEPSASSTTFDDIMTAAKADTEHRQAERQQTTNRIPSVPNPPNPDIEAVSKMWDDYFQSDVVDINSILPPPFEWIEIPAGKVTLVENDDKSYFGKKGEKKTFDVSAFTIAKYPVTNAQFASFLEAGGYSQQHWWTKAGWEEKLDRKWIEPRYWQDKKWNQPNHPVVGVSWYEAIAFCLWLSAQLNVSVGAQRAAPSASSSSPTLPTITLPTEQQWQRAAQGDDNPAYPWGNLWDCNRCNNSMKPCDSSSTTAVTQYEGRDKGNSPFDVVDMAGNMWEWCLTSYEMGGTELDGTNVRVLHGGSWHVNGREFFRADFRYRNDPYYGSDDWGFRLVRS